MVSKPSAFALPNELKGIISAALAAPLTFMTSIYYIKLYSLSIYLISEIISDIIPYS